MIIFTHHVSMHRHSQRFIQSKSRLGAQAVNLLFERIANKDNDNHENTALRSILNSLFANQFATLINIKLFDRILNFI